MKSSFLEKLESEFFPGMVIAYVRRVLCFLKLPLRELLHEKVINMLCYVLPERLFYGRDRLTLYINTVCVFVVYDKNFIKY